MKKIPDLGQNLKTSLGMCPTQSTHQAFNVSLGLGTLPKHHDVAVQPLPDNKARDLSGR